MHLQNSVKTGAARMLFKKRNKRRLLFYRAFQKALTDEYDIVPALENIYQMYTRNGKQWHVFGAIAKDLIKAHSLAVYKPIFRRWFPERERDILIRGFQVNRISMSLWDVIELAEGRTMEMR